MQKLESQLDDMLVKKAPFQIPENGRRALVSALPWLTLLGGVLMLWSAWAVWQLVSLADRFAGVANQLGALYGTGYVAPASASPLLWVSLVILLIEAVLFFVAFPALRVYQKRGWDILFWVSIVNAVQSVVQAIAYTNFASLVMSLIGTVIGLYLLFQIRSYYTGEKKMPVTTAGTTPTPTPTSTPTPTPPTTPTVTPTPPAATTPPVIKTTPEDKV